MKSNKLLRSFLIGCTLFAAASLSAQTLVTRWEAEDFVGNGFQVDVNNIPVVVSAAHSGGKYVQRTSQSNSLMYYVNVTTQGVYDLKIYYMIKTTGDQIGKKIAVRVNNQVIRGTEVTELTDADNSATPACLVFPVYLDAGINLIRIGQNKLYIPNSGYAPNFDYFELYTSEATLEKPQDDTEANIKDSLTPFIEAGDFTKIPGIFSVTTLSGNTTAANLIDNNPATEFVSDNETETITISYPASLGIFCLRGIAATNPYVRISAIERSKDGITWDATGLRSHALFDLNKAVSYSTVSIWRSTDEPTQDTNFKDYIYYRFTVTKPSWESQLKISDLKICGSFQSYVDLTEAANGTPTLTATGNIDGSNGVANAFDNNFGSKVSYTTTSYTIIYPFNQFAKVNHYSLTTAGGVNNSLARDAKSWTFEGSVNGIDYVVLDNVTDHVWANVKRATYLHKIQSPSIYKYYKLNITAKQGTDAILHFGEIQMFGTLESSITTNVEETNYSNANVVGRDRQIVIRNNAVVSYQIFDITGKILKEGKINSSELTVPVAKGVYMVKTTDANSQSKVAKVVVR